MKSRLALAIMVLASFLIAPNLGPDSASAVDHKTVYIRNLWPDIGNKNLHFCGDSGTTGCIETLTIDDFDVVETDVQADADYEIAGGVYGRTCRFVDTTAKPCETPYFHIYPRGSGTLETATIDFRRFLNGSATSTIGVVLASGEIRDFEPATPAGSDVAHLEVDAVEINNVYPAWVIDQFAVCFGYFTLISSCPMPATAPSRTTSRISILMMPSQVSTAVPADIGSDCSGPEDPSGCFVLVFERSGIGSWMDSDAAFYGGTEATRGSNAIDFRVSGPHLTTTGALNTGRFRSFMTDEYLATALGMTADQANSDTMPVRRLSDGDATPLTVTYEVVPGGLLVTTSNITFSSPIIRTSRVVKLSTGSRLSASALIGAAGLSSVQRYYRSTISYGSARGISRRGSTYSFSKAGTYIVTFRYKTSRRASLSSSALTVVVS